MYKLIAFVGVVLAGVFVAPVAASAVPYTPGAQVVASAYNLTPGESTTITAGTGFFGGSQSVHVAISGTDASDWSTPGSLHSSSSGGASFTLKAPASSTGHYTVTLTSPSASGSVLLTVTPSGTDPVTKKKGHSSTPALSGNNSGTTTAAGSGSTLANSTSDANENDTTQGLDALSNGSSGTPALTAAGMQMIIVWALVALLALLLAFIIVTRIRRKEQTES